MSLTTGALQIGRSALLAYQSALQVVGNNISNAGVEGYTRQSAVLTTNSGVFVPEGFTPGGGVSLTGLRRNLDESLENELRRGMSDYEASNVEREVLGRIESIFNELSDSDISTLLQDFFNSFSEMQNSPEEDSPRQMVMAQAKTLATEIQRQRTSLLELRDEINGTIDDVTDRAGELADEIATLNVQITALESASRGGANALRDQRDGYLRELSQLVEITVREQPDGGINVYVGNEPLVQGGLSRGLTTTLETFNQEPKAVVRFEDNGGEVNLLSGELAGLVNARDAHVLGQVAQLDSLSAAIINEVNKVHSSGQGLQGFASVLGTYDVLNSAAALNSEDAGLNLTPQNGSFLITVTNKNTGAEVTSTIEVDLDGVGADDSLDTLAAKLDALDNITAIATSDNRLQITSDNGYEFTFSDDSSYTLAALGINTFFQGRDSEDIAVNTKLTGAGGSLLIAGAAGGGPGDGMNAANIAALGVEAIETLGGQSLNGFYNAIASEVAVKGAAANAAVEAADAINMSLLSQRESISGVSLDEETIQLLRLERAFQGAARYTTTVDQLISEVLQLVG